MLSVCTYVTFFSKDNYKEFINIFLCSMRFLLSMILVREFPSEKFMCNDYFNVWKFVLLLKRKTYLFRIFSWWVLYSMFVLFWCDIILSFISNIRRFIFYGSVRLTNILSGLLTFSEMLREKMLRMYSKFIYLLRNSFTSLICVLPCW